MWFKFSCALLFLAQAHSHCITPIGANVPNINVTPYPGSDCGIPPACLAAFQECVAANPGTFTINGDNLEIVGNVGVSGAIPFLGTIALNGNVPAAGQARVAYETSPGVGLVAGGCGYNVPPQAPQPPPCAPPCGY